MSGSRFSCSRACVLLSLHRPSQSKLPKSANIHQSKMQHSRDMLLLVCVSSEMLCAPLYRCIVLNLLLVDSKRVDLFKIDPMSLSRCFCKCGASVLQAPSWFCAWRMDGHLQSRRCLTIRPLLQEKFFP